MFSVVVRVSKCKQNRSCIMGHANQIFLTLVNGAHHSWLKGVFDIRNIECVEVWLVNWSDIGNLVYPYLKIQSCTVDQSDDEIGTLILKWVDCLQPGKDENLLVVVLVRDFECSEEIFLVYHKQNLYRLLGERVALQLHLVTLIQE